MNIALNHKPFRGVVHKARTKEYRGGIRTITGELEGQPGIPFESTKIVEDHGALVETENSIYGVL